MKLDIENFICKNYTQSDLTNPIFDSKEFSKHSKNILKIINKKPKKSSSLTYNVPKDNLTRRKINIPNPYSYLILSNCIIENIDEITNFYSKSSLSKSKPQLVLENNKFQFKRSFKDFRKSKIEFSTLNRYLLKIDFSRYYSTIYTHSIPWCLHGKIKAKKEKNNHNLLGNQLDFLISLVNDNQTHGIPTGPFASHFISEIIGCKLDSLVEKEFPEIQGFRFVDDFYLYFKEKNEAEKCLIFIQKITQKIDLELNENKTKILELPSQIEEEWLYNIRNFNFRENNTENDIISYFNLLFGLVKKFEKDSVLKYGIKSSNSFKIKPKDWDLYETFLLQSISLDARAIPEIVEILIKYFDSELFSVNKNKISESLKLNIKYYLEKNYFFEVSWLLYLALYFEIELNEEISKELSKIEDNISILISLELEKKNLIKLNKKRWEEIVDNSEIYGENWLLIYQTNKDKIFKNKLTELKKDIFYNYLLENNISFLNFNKKPENMIIYNLKKIENEFENEFNEYEEVEDEFDSFFLY